MGYFIREPLTEGFDNTKDAILDLINRLYENREHVDNIFICYTIDNAESKDKYENPMRWRTFDSLKEKSEITKFFRMITDHLFSRIYEITEHNKYIKELAKSVGKSMKEAKKLIEELKKEVEEIKEKQE